MQSCDINWVLDDLRRAAMGHDQNLFKDRLAVLATMHRKEQVIQPILKQELGIDVVVPPDFDTDWLGTFTREVNRPGSQRETARLKAQKALTVTGATLAVASEGSFGPHPECPFLAANLEMVLLLDAENSIEIVGESLTTQTNYAQQEITSLKEALLFANKAGFPEHGLVVFGESECVKGIVETEHLLTVLQQKLQRRIKVRLETDMRALYNPTRMANIAQATHDLIAKVRSCCPRCGLPGFRVVRRRQGLPCEWCLTPTGLLLTDIYGCKGCGFEQEEHFPGGQEFAQPMHCPVCNP